MLPAYQDIPRPRILLHQFLDTLAVRLATACVDSQPQILRQGFDRLIGTCAGPARLWLLSDDVAYVVLRRFAKDRPEALCALHPLSVETIALGGLLPVTDEVDRAVGSGAQMQQAETEGAEEEVEAEALHHDSERMAVGKEKKLIQLKLSKIKSINSIRDPISQN